MTDTFAPILDGLAAAVAAIDGLNAYPSVAEALTAPFAGVSEIEIDYNQTFATSSLPGMIDTLFTYGVFVGRGGDSQTSRSDLAAYLAVSGDTSVKAAIETDRSLGGACKTLIVERVRGAYRLYEIGGTSYLGALFDVRVWS